MQQPPRDAREVETELERLRARVKQLEAEIEESERLRKEVESLKAEIKKKDDLIQQYQRSTKRQAAPFSKGPPKARPKRPGRKRGPRYGPKAHRPPPQHVDETYDSPLPDHCPDCGGRLITDSVQPQYQVEIPRKPITRQFNVAFGHCKNCGAQAHGHHSLQTNRAVGAAASQLGPDAQSLAVHLNKEAGLSHGKIARFFQSAFGVSLSRGGSAQIMLRAAQRCTSAYLNILVFVRQSPWVVPDETGWKVAGLLQWLHVFVTQWATLYVIRPSRGHDVAADVLGLDYAGHMVHDGWQPYDRFVYASHTQCNAHLLRRCGQLVEDACGRAVTFPRQVKRLLLQGLALRDARDAGFCSQRAAERKVVTLEDRLFDLCSPKAHLGNRRLAKFIARHLSDIFNYIWQPGTDATNYRGEQAIRPAVVNRKVWGGNRTDRGAHAEGVLKSVFRTANQLGYDSIDFLTKTLRAPTGCEPQLVPK